MCVNFVFATFLFAATLQKGDGFAIFVKLGGKFVVGGRGEL